MKTKQLIIYSFLLFSILGIAACSQQENLPNQTAYKNSDAAPRQFFRLMFYNVENLFDVYNDSVKRDDEFLPEGAKRWTSRRYYKKLNNIAKVIAGVGGWEPPEVIGLCELENRFVVEGIVKHSPLKKFNYKIIHKESPDRRGIDVALIYRPEKFFPLKYEAIPIVFPFDTARKTRDVLYVKGTTVKKDTLHIFVNHWPSRWGGQLASERGRVFVASVVRNKVDSLFKVDKNPKIIITGDLNDFPVNKSITEVLNAKSDFDNIKSKELYNLAHYQQVVKHQGSHKYQGEWGVLDQIIISGALLDNKNTLYTTKDDAHIYDAEFLLEKDEKNVGVKPFRTYVGFKFHDGYSDHLPVYLDLKRK